MMIKIKIQGLNPNPETALKPVSDAEKMQNEEVENNQENESENTEETKPPRTV